MRSISQERSACLHMGVHLAKCLLLNSWVLMQGHSRAGEVPQLSANVLQVSDLMHQDGRPLPLQCCRVA